MGLLIGGAGWQFGFEGGQGDCAKLAPAISTNSSTAFFMGSPFMSFGIEPFSIGKWDQEAMYEMRCCSCGKALGWLHAAIAPPSLMLFCNPCSELPWPLSKVVAP